MNIEELKRKLVDLDYKLRDAVDNDLRGCFVRVFGPAPTIGEYYLYMDMHNFFMSAIRGYFNTILMMLAFTKQYEEG